VSYFAAAYTLLLVLVVAYTIYVRQRLVDLKKRLELVEAIAKEKQP
jgi:hypothetical protein